MGPFDQDLQTRGPRLMPPGLEAGNPWGQLALQQFPGPTGSQALGHAGIHWGLAPRAVRDQM